MYVRKFEADSIDEALKEIKRELGPDAVILKTITNNGLKGAFKKKKIEITAAISQKDYVRKANVDHVLNENQKEEFYNGSASYIANMIDQHDQSKERASVQHNKSQPSKSGYGSAGLNKQVNSTKSLASQFKEGLDEFLSLGERDLGTNGEDFDFDSEINNAPRAQRSTQRPAQREVQREVQREAQREISREASPTPTTSKVYQEERYIQPQTSSVQTQPSIHQQVSNSSMNQSGISASAFEEQKGKIEDLEKKIFELTRSLERVSKKEAAGIFQLRTILKSLDINETFIQQLSKKGMYELTDSDLENADAVFEYALKEMMANVSTAMPLVADASSKNQPTITVFLSELSCGQTSMVEKVAASTKDCVIIRNVSKNSTDNSASFAQKMFGFEVINAKSLAEMAGEVRKAYDNRRNIFIDFNCTGQEANETKKFIDGMRRAFSRVEVLISLSAIHTELYNRKIIGSYGKLSDGTVVSHLDVCLNFGSLFNITNEFKKLPFKYFGTGEVTPDDIEVATAERIMAGIFKLS